MNLQLWSEKFRADSGDVAGGYSSAFLQWTKEGGVRELVHQMEEIDRDHLIICGYSLGGDYAILLAYWLTVEYGIRASVVTLNYSFGNDPVSQFPPPWFGWTIPGKTLHFGGPRNFFMDWDSHYLEHFYQLVDEKFVFEGPASINY